jgi:hypothetical protein
MRQREIAPLFQCSLTDTEHRNPKTLETLQILKDAYRKGIIDPDAKEARR